MEIVKLKPSMKEHIWGGTKLKKYKDTTQDILSECWELSFHEDGPCLVDSGENKGQYLKDAVTCMDLGEKVSTFPLFPVLIKLIDSSSNLSVQVHPNDEYSLKNESSLGKTEMWHILDADPGCGLYVGLKEDSSKEKIKKILEDGNILDSLNFFEVKPGENYFIPAGTIHAIGKGVTLIEIQQSSNVTYRLYDYKRKDKNGNERELHIEKALEVIDYHKYEPITFKGNVIGECEYFSSSIHDEKDDEIITSSSSFASITFLDGYGKIDDLEFKKYDTFFIPANKTYHINSKKCSYIKTIVK